MDRLVWCKLFQIDLKYYKAMVGLLFLVPFNERSMDLVIFEDQMDSVFDGYVGDRPLNSAFIGMTNLREIIAKLLQNLTREVCKCCSNSI